MQAVEGDDDEAAAEGQTTSQIGDRPAHPEPGIETGQWVGRERSMKNEAQSKHRHNKQSWESRAGDWRGNNSQRNYDRDVDERGGRGMSAQAMSATAMGGTTG